MIKTIGAASRVLSYNTGSFSSVIGKVQTGYLLPVFSGKGFTTGVRDVAEAAKIQEQ